MICGSCYKLIENDEKLHLDGSHNFDFRACFLKLQE